jgi:hypothetical protein
MSPNADNPTPVPAPADEKLPQAAEPLAPGLLPIPPMIQRSLEAYRRDLPELMKTHYGQWVAYHGDQRLGFSRSKTALVQECLRRGIRDEEFIVDTVEPEIPDDDVLELTDW